MSSHDWLKARLQLVLTDQQRILDSTCDEDEIEDAEAVLDLAKKLLEMLPTIFQCQCWRANYALPRRSIDAEYYG